MEKHILIVGAGFAGLNTAKVLGNKKKLKITVIDRRNYHLFQPLLYQVATAGLSPAEIAAPIRSLLSKYINIRVLLGNVTSVDLKNKSVTILDPVNTSEAVTGSTSPTNITTFASPSTLSYDYLILACGAKHSYFGHNEWEERAPGLKTLEQATEIRRRLLIAYEMAEKETNPEIQKKWLTFVIVGAGPTGVELAGAIGEISRYTLEKDFRKIDPSRTRILLIEAGPRILGTFSERLAKKASRDLEALGVHIWTNTRVTNISDQGVHLGSELIDAKTVLWAAGVQPSSLSRSLQVPLDKSGRVIIEKNLSLKNYPEVFVLGDQALVEGDKGPLPGLAPVAIQEGVFAAQNILRSIKGMPTLDFKYFDKGQMATIGRTKAIAQINKLEFSGFVAWLAWLLIHIYYLIGFKNRIFVLLEWAWSYLTFKRGARLIVNKEWRSVPQSKPDGGPHLPGQNGGSP